nr:MAG TPA: hypothetical protein [Caudoviricetes sp.]
MLMLVGSVVAFHFLILFCFLRFIRSFKSFFCFLLVLGVFASLVPSVGCASSLNPLFLRPSFLSLPLTSLYKMYTLK